MSSEGLRTGHAVASGYDGARHWEKVLTLEEHLALNPQRYDHYLDELRDMLQFRNAAGAWIEVRLSASGLGRVSSKVLAAGQLNAGFFLDPADYVDLTGHEFLRNRNNLSRHFVTLRRVHQECCDQPHFVVTRRSGGLAGMWPRERTFVRVERILPVATGTAA